MPGPVLDLGRAQRIHVVGAGGSGMAPIARILVAMGHAVSGSDQSWSSRLAELERRFADLEDRFEAVEDRLKAVEGHQFDADEEKPRSAHRGTDEHHRHAEKAPAAHRCLLSARRRPPRPARVRGSRPAHLRRSRLAARDRGRRPGDA
ncbi:MAG: hypothetical protein KY450_02860 [Actinobacteria bacterium]|nr:hypothetical protein [Actinomycetota bacterium]